MAEANAKPVVLLIDDEDDFRKVATRRIQMAGFDVVTAMNGQEGLDTAKAKHPGVILLDVMMPVLNGYEVLKLLRQNPSTEHIPVIMLTAKGTERDMAASIEQGAVVHMVKPYQPTELFEEIKRALVKHERAHEGNGSPA